jgi:hypothetical protein
VDVIIRVPKKFLVNRAKLMNENNLKQAKKEKKKVQFEYNKN